MEESVPFLYKQYKSAMIIGKEQPFKRLPPSPQPSFEVRTSKAIKIQSEPLFWVQQFIRKPPVFYRGRYVRSFLSRSFVFLIILYSIASEMCVCF